MSARHGSLDPAEGWNLQPDQTFKQSTFISEVGQAHPIGRRYATL